jgi:hypothetical protein
VWPSARHRQGSPGRSGGRHFSGRQRTYGREGLAVLAALSGASLLVAACGGSSPSAHRVTSSARSATTATPTPNAEEAAIIAAYRAAVKAFQQSVAIPDPAYPALAATTVDPLLHTLRLNLVTDKLNGIVGRGPIQLLHPHVVSRSATQAVVLDCEFDQSVLVYKVNGNPVQGQPGGTSPQYEGVRATLVMTPSGWKLSDTNVRLGQCPAGY